ncbi:MAG: histidine kinase dimerization/phospho-acceptor domain-containing protein [Desulfohalobiaceae bacterium]
MLWNDVDWEVTYFLIPGRPGSWTVAWILYNLTGKEEKSRVNAALAVAGAISHELSQPLTAIVNSAQLLVDTPLDNLERLKRHKNIISRESSRVFDLHRKLQNISKYKLKDYLDTHIFDLDESSELSLTIPDTPDEE